MAQKTKVEEIISNSLNFYKKLSSFSVSVDELIKPPISEDTSRSRFRCFIKDTESLFLVSKKDVGIYVDNDSEYWVDIENKKHSRTKPKDRKHTAYFKLFKDYPFAKTEEFFKKINNGGFSLVESDSSFVLQSLTTKIVFRRSDFSIQRIVERSYDSNFKGSFYRESIFSDIIVNDQLGTDYLASVSEILKSGNTAKHLANTSNKPLEIFDRSILNRADLNVVNGKLDSLDNKYILLDFFYSSCVPCYKSYPFINKIHNNRNADFLVIGVDPVLSDTLNIEKFLSRFDIHHPIIMGYSAEELAKLPSLVNGYPTFVLIHPNGKILEIQNGFSESFLKRITKLYSTAN